MTHGRPHRRSLRPGNKSEPAGRRAVSGAAEIGGARTVRLVLILAAAAAALALLGAAGTVLAFPFGAAAACPACYGFERLPGNIFIERAASPEQRGHVAAVLAQARGRVAAFYGSADTQPRILVCVSDDCYSRIR